MVASNARFLTLADSGALPNLASCILSTMTRRLSANRLSAYGHGLLLAESLCDPEQHSGSMDKAANWEEIGTSKGHARANGRYTSRHGKPKHILVCQLRRDARRLLSREDPVPPDIMPPSEADREAEGS